MSSGTIRRTNPIVLADLHFEADHPNTLAVTLVGAGGTRVAFDINERAQVSRGTIGGTVIQSSTSRTVVPDPNDFAMEAGAKLQATVGFDHWGFQATDANQALSILFRRNHWWFWVWPSTKAGTVVVLRLGQGSPTGPSIRHPNAAMLSFEEASTLIMRG